MILILPPPSSSLLYVDLYPTGSTGHPSHPVLQTSLVLHYIRSHTHPPHGGSTQFYRLHSYFIISGAILTLHTVDLLTLHIIDRQGRGSGFRQFKADHRLTAIWIRDVLMQGKTALTATDPKIYTLQRFTAVRFC